MKVIQASAGSTKAGVPHFPLVLQPIEPHTPRVVSDGQQILRKSRETKVERQNQRKLSYPQFMQMKIPLCQRKCIVRHMPLVLNSLLNSEYFTAITISLVYTVAIF